MYYNPYYRPANFVRTEKISGDDTQLVLTLPARALCNRSTLCICIAQPIPSEVGKDSIVKIQVGTDEYAVGTPCGNFIYGDQVREGKFYCFKFGTDTLAFIYRGGWRLCRTQHAFTCIPLPPAPVKTMLKVSTSSKKTKAPIKED